MKYDLHGKKVAILVADGFEQVEMTSPRQALQEAGAETVLISPNSGYVNAFKHDKPGDRFPSQLPVENAHAADFDALVLPGGVASPDRLRTIPAAVKFVKDFVQSGKPVAAICHGPWTLVEANAVRGRTLTSWPSLRTDIINAGGHWVDVEVATDNGIVSSRKPDDLPAFNEKMRPPIKYCTALHIRVGGRFVIIWYPCIACHLPCHARVLMP